MCFMSMLEVQRFLSKGQAVPILGLPVSAIKSAVSVTEIIAGFAGTIIFGSGAVLSGCNEKAAELAFKSAGHIALGSASLAYSIGNIVTLTAVGYCIEGKDEEDSCCCM